MSYSSTVLSDSPIRFYKLNENSGTVATDYGSQAQNGTLHGGITLAQTGLLVSDPDTSMLFNGSTGYITLPTTGLPTGANAWTMEGWVKFTSVPSGGNYPVMLQIGTFGTSTKSAYIYFNGDSRAFGGVADGLFSLFTALPVTAGHVYYLAFTYDGTTGSFYCYDATAGTADTHSFTGTMNLTYGGATIGSSGATAFSWSGYAQEEAIYNTALSSAQVLAHYNAGIAVIHLRISDGYGGVFS